MKNIYIRNILWATLALVFIVLGSGLLNQGERIPIRVGFIGPLTGDAAPIGAALRHAVELAVLELGTTTSRSIEIVYEDGKCSGKDSISAAQKLINIDMVRFIIGGMCSGETLAAAPVAEAAHVLLISPVSTSPDIMTAGEYIFRTIASDASSGAKIADALYDRGLHTVAVVAEETDYAQSLKKVFESRYTSHGGNVVMSESYVAESRDFRTLVAKVKSAKPQAVYFVPQSPESALIFLNEVAKQGVRVPLFTNELANTPSLLHAAEGAIFAEVDFNPDSPEIKAFIAAYTDRYGALDASTPLAYAVAAYDTTKLLIDLLIEEGDRVERVKDRLYKVQDWQGAGGALTIDQNGDAVREYVLKQIILGEATPLDRPAAR